LRLDIVFTGILQFNSVKLKNETQRCKHLTRAFTVVDLLGAHFQQIAHSHSDLHGWRCQLLSLLLFIE